MSSPATERLWSLARHLLDLGQTDAAIERLLELLGLEPEFADAHALLALCLVSRKRLHAAELEAGRAAELDPESPFAHLALATVLTARRRYDQAEAHLRTLLELEPDSAQAHAGLSRVWDGRGQRAKALEEARLACSLAPEDATYQARLGWLALRAGDRTQAAEQARAALELEPELQEALVLMGQCELAAGHVQAAHEHAVWALQADPGDEGALTLLAAVKARRSLVLGAWWRFQNFVSAGSSHRAMVILIGLYLAYRTAGIALDQAGLHQAALPLSVLWLGFCAYTWFAPGLFRRAISREMRSVRLREDF